MLSSLEWNVSARIPGNYALDGVDSQIMRGFENVAVQGILILEEFGVYERLRSDPESVRRCPELLSRYVIVLRPRVVARELKTF
jgi:hypothetical protein